jgi:ABC-type bacteriocin/lantibiotic exporter with double-glycine peptidase domain
MTAIPIPYRKQETDVYCGPTIVQMILAAHGIELTQHEIAVALGTTEEAGTMADSIQRYFATHGFAVTCTNEAQLSDVESVIAAGRYVVVGYVEPTEDVPHYGIVKEITAQDIIIIDPWNGADHIMAREIFEERWRDDSAAAYGNRMMMAVSMPKK